MKKIVFLVVALSCSSFVFAQKDKNSSAANQENRPLYFGVSVGPTIDWFAPMPKEEDFKLVREKPKVGFIAGINVDVNLTKGRWLYFSTGLLVRYLQGELAFDHQYDIPWLPDTLSVFSTVRTYKANYLVIPTGVKFRTPPSRGCVFVGKVGLYHQFKLGGDKFDSFAFPDLSDYLITTPSVKNDDAALFAETGYAGIGFEYIFKSNIRVFLNADYSCQFNYFSANAVSNVVADARFRAIVHSLQVSLGVLF